MSDLTTISSGTATPPLMTLVRGVYRWCRDATAETHDWPTNKVKA